MVKTTVVPPTFLIYICMPLGVDGCPQLAFELIQKTLQKADGQFEKAAFLCSALQNVQHRFLNNNKLD